LNHVLAYLLSQVNVSSWYFLPIYFQAVLGASPTRSGALLLPIVVVQAIAGVIAGAFIHHFGRVREVIWTGTATMTLGFGLFMSLTPSSTFATIGVFEVIAGVGVGMIFQAPLLVYQSLVEEDDLNVATALFGFVRSLSTSASVVLGEVVFQNGMKGQHHSIAETLRPGQASNFTATLAASNALQVHFLSPHAREVVEHAYAQSLQDMWILYTSVAGIGVLVAVFVMPKVLLQTQSRTGVVSQTEDNNQ
jgi:MFS family permease